MKFFEKSDQLKICEKLHLLKKLNLLTCIFFPKLVKNCSHNAAVRSIFFQIVNMPQNQVILAQCFFFIIRKLFQSIRLYIKGMLDGQPATHHLANT